MTKTPRELQDFIADLSDRKFSIVETIKAVRTHFELSLREAKHAVCQHSSFAPQIAANASLHDELQDLLDRTERSEGGVAE